MGVFQIVQMVPNRAELLIGTAQKLKFSIKDLVTLTEEILNGKLHFLCSDIFVDIQSYQEKYQT